jgi:H/ACA ribonucleoprotein complex subunit 4
MTLKQLENLRVIDQDIPNDSHGTYYDKRSIEQLLDYGFILLDKPNGPTSHETVAWVKKIVNIPKAGHSGTLDPQVSGILPVGFGGATKELIVLLLGPKEYHALGRLHSLPTKEKLDNVLKLLTGKIYQKPPQRSSVSRQTRVRTVYEIEIIEQKERLLLARILCEAGTYIRKIFYDMGEILGPGATMIELRRTRVGQFNEDSNLVKMHDLVDAYALWKEKNDESKLRRILMPIEYCLSEIKSVVIRDSAVDALCHGAQLAIPGILEISHELKKGDLVGIYTLKGEIVALAEAIMSEDEIVENTKGFAFQIKRIIMAPNTYPKNWRSKALTIKKETDSPSAS